MTIKTMNKIIKYINENNNFLICSHISPDGDSLGSSIALGLILKKLGKTVTYHIDPIISNNYSFLLDIEDIKSTKNNKNNKYDIGICLDCSSLDHLYHSDILKKCKTTINIDHHISNQSYGDINFVDSTASATGEIIYELSILLKVPLNKKISTALYTSIVTDTGNFKYSNTTSKTHFIVSKLLQEEIAAWKINKILFDEHSKSKILLSGRAIKNLHFFLDNHLAITVINQKDLEEVGASPDEVEGLINIARSISGVEVSVLLKETSSDEYKVSFRSNEYVDVGNVALKLGGGGHSRASGCKMIGNKDDIIETLKIIIQKNI